MISNNIRETRKGRVPRMPKNIERLYKEGKCSECSVVVTKMDFAKILGKFTKVKIQYESDSTPKTRRDNLLETSPNARLKNNENGMVLIHRNAYKKHPANLLKTSKPNEKPTTPRNKAQNSPRANNILKENNQMKKTPTVSKNKDGGSIIKKVFKSGTKSYGIVFVNPKTRSENNRNIISLQNLLPCIDKSILPSEGWCIDYLPKQGEPKEDKVYDRIAAELEDLMNNEKSSVKADGPKLETKSESGESKDDFPSIMDILNDNTAPMAQGNNQSNSLVQTNLESSDVEAMLLGKSSEIPSDTVKVPETMPMEVDNTDISSLLSAATDNSNISQDNPEIMDNPHSPSILDETLEKGIEEHLPKEPVSQQNSIESKDSTYNSETEVTKQSSRNDSDVKFKSVTHVVFKKFLNGVCSKSVTCPKNLKFSVELEGKTVQFLGAPIFITSLEDLKVLLQIVDETELNSLYVLH